MFQFTHPGRGATPAPSDDPNTNPVSIHAPREGCDKSLTTSKSVKAWFQFTHPGRGATRIRELLFLLIGGFNSRTPGGVRLNGVDYRTSALQFQFTHPGRGATGSDSEASKEEVVSIHAPREGCDLLPPLLALRW